MLRFSPLGPVMSAVATHPASQHTVQSLAATARVSSRTLFRLFHQELGTTPAKYVELARLNEAMRQLDAGHSVTRAAEHSGFGTSENLRRAFIAHRDESPSAYRRRSGGPASGRSA
jgi:transcriptional regulator GlxA family with amidase domain